MKIDNNKQTAVDWLIRKLYESIALPSKHIEEIKAKAKAMEKEQIENAFENGVEDIIYSRANYEDGEQYYNETFEDTK
jgi:hypothetical protein